MKKFLPAIATVLLAPCLPAAAPKPEVAELKPLLEWDNNMGCVTVTYNPVLKKYIMCVTDGGNMVSRMNTYLLEADRLDGD